MEIERTEQTKAYKIFYNDFGEMVIRQPGLYGYTESDDPSVSDSWIRISPLQFKQFLKDIKEFINSPKPEWLLNKE